MSLVQAAGGVVHSHQHVRCNQPTSPVYLTVSKCIQIAYDRDLQTCGAVHSCSSDTCDSGSHAYTPAHARFPIDISDQCATVGPIRTSGQANWCNICSLRARRLIAGPNCCKWWRYACSHHTQLDIQRLSQYLLDLAWAKINRHQQYTISLNTG